jgi:hypothetical protein
VDSSYEGGHLGPKTIYPLPVSHVSTGTKNIYPLWGRSSWLKDIYLLTYLPNGHLGLKTISPVWVPPFWTIDINIIDFLFLMFPQRTFIHSERGHFVAKNIYFLWAPPS